MSVQNTVVQYLDQATLMQLVTWSGTTPWIATLFFAADNRHYLYWLSEESSRHSRELLRNNKVIGAITVPHDYGQPWQGLQFEGTARLVPATEVNAAYQAYAERYNAHYRLQGILDATDNSRLFQLVPSVFTLYDQAGSPTQPRQEWRLDSGTVQSTAAPSTTAPEAEKAPFNPLDY